MTEAVDYPTWFLNTRKLVEAGVDARQSWGGLPWKNSIEGWCGHELVEVELSRSYPQSSKLQGPRLLPCSRWANQRSRLEAWLIETQSEPASDRGFTPQMRWMNNAMHSYRHQISRLGASDHCSSVVHRGEGRWRSLRIDLQNEKVKLILMCAFQRLSLISIPLVARTCTTHVQSDCHSATIPTALLRFEQQPMMAPSKPVKRAFAIHEAPRRSGCVHIILYWDPS